MDNSVELSTDLTHNINNYYSIKQGTLMKIFLKIIATFVILIITGIVALSIFINPNDYKTEIEGQAAKALNRDLAINGDLGWVFFPSLGIQSGQIELKNAVGFTQNNLAKIDELSISINILPLLSGEIVLGKLSLDGLVFNLETNVDGLSNLENIGSQTASSVDSEQAAVTVVEEKPSSKQATELPQLTLAGIEISNTKINIIDEQLGSNTALTIELIELGKFELGQDTALDILLNVVTDEFVGDLNLHALLNVDDEFAHINLNELTLKGSLKGENVPAGQMNIFLTSKVFVNLSPVTAEINALAIDVNGMTLGGDASVALLEKTKVRFDLVANQWDLNPLIPETQESDEVVVEKTEPTPEVEPDLSVLTTLDVDGKITVAGFKAKGLNIGETLLKVNVNNGTAKIEPLSVNLYEGNMMLNASLSHDNGNNSYEISKKLTDVKVFPLLKDVADIELIAGTTNFELVAKGSGLTVSKIKQGLEGHGSFAITDGAIYGVNVAQKIRAIKETLGSDSKGGDIEKKTDFSALNGSFTINNGIVDNTSLDMEAPFIRLAGKGTADIIKELVDYHLNVKLVSTSKGQGGDENLSGLAIPLKVTGSFSEPKFGIDTNGLISAKVDEQKAKLKEKADAKKDELKDKLKNKLKGLF